MIREGAIQSPSPNFKPFKIGERPIRCVVIHATATNGIDSPRMWLCNPESKVSAHYLIGKDGLTYQLVDDNNVAWHAGESEWAGEKWVNGFSIGIELVNKNDGKDPYPVKQLGVCTRLVAALCKEHNIGLKNVVAHADIAPGRKNDPLGFPWGDFRNALEDAVAA